MERMVITLLQYFNYGTFSCSQNVGLLCTNQDNEQQNDKTYSYEEVTEVLTPNIVRNCSKKFLNSVLTSALRQNLATYHIVVRQDRVKVD